MDIVYILYFAYSSNILNRNLYIFFNFLTP